jgi:hypothetical protein
MGYSNAFIAILKMPYAPAQLGHIGQLTEEKDIYIEHRAGKAARLASWRKMTPSGRDLLEMVALEGNLSLRISPPPPIFSIFLRTLPSIATVSSKITHRMQAGAGDPCAHLPFMLGIRAATKDGTLSSGGFWITTLFKGLAATCRSFWFIFVVLECIIQALQDRTGITCFYMNTYMEFLMVASQKLAGGR